MPDDIPGSGYKTTVEANLKVAELMQNAHDDITRIRGIVRNSANDLVGPAGYTGADGKAYQDLLASWDADVMKVEQGLEGVKETMIRNSGQQQNQQDDLTGRINRFQSVITGLKG
ncbi:WXG100 family type VII secretion target [Streptomyces sp. NPDC090025]|uniref:WXG100 family type VII secretion target n=1 Tax=Streptomyces sp. NPDC090025 TaxID=3365922 RepID=UPI0038393453